MCWLWSVYFGKASDTQMAFFKLCLHQKHVKKCSKHTSPFLTPRFLIQSFTGEAKIYTFIWNPQVAIMQVPCLHQCWRNLNPRNSDLGKERDFEGFRNYGAWKWYSWDDPYTLKTGNFSLGKTNSHCWRLKSFVKSIEVFL